MKDKRIRIREIVGACKSMKCVIREWKIEDKKQLAENLNNKNVLNNLRDGLPYPYTEEDAAFYINMMLSADKDKTFAFAITVDDKVIGSIGVFRQDNIHNRTAELGYYIGEAHWGKGYMTSAVKQICDYVFNNTDIIRIFAEPFSYNIGSCRVLEKSGFTYEGTLKNNAYKNGRFLDMKMYARVKCFPKESDISKYLACDDVIDWDNAEIKKLADDLWEKADSKLAFIKDAYEYVRDNISHSADVGEDVLTCSASEVLKEGHGICFAKSHLLAAILRAKSIPAGLCYQKLILDDEIVPVLVYHGLNAVYLEECNKWIRLDARSNKEGVNAQFSIEEEQLAFPIHPELGEEDGYMIYASPDEKILEKFKNNKTRSELWKDLPTELAEK